MAILMVVVPKNVGNSVRRLYQQVIFLEPVCKFSRATVVLICMYVYLDRYIHIYSYMYVCVLYTKVLLYMYACICIHIYIYTHLYVCIDICVYVSYKHMQTHMQITQCSSKSFNLESMLPSPRHRGSTWNPPRDAVGIPTTGTRRKGFDLEPSG